MKKTKRKRRRNEYEEEERRINGKRFRINENEKK